MSSETRRVPARSLQSTGGQGLGLPALGWPWPSVLPQDKATLSCQRAQLQNDVS